MIPLPRRVIRPLTHPPDATKQGSRSYQFSARFTPQMHILNHYKRTLSWPAHRQLKIESSLVLCALIN